MGVRFYLTQRREGAKRLGRWQVPVKTAIDPSLAREHAAQSNALCGVCRIPGVQPGPGLFLADLLEFDFAQSDPGWKFMWVGVGLSLPVTLLGARAFGEQAYRDYWSYLESFPRNSRKGILAAWGGMTSIYARNRNRLLLGCLTFRGGLDVRAPCGSCQSNRTAARSARTSASDGRRGANSGIVPMHRSGCPA